MLLLQRFFVAILLLCVYHLLLHTFTSQLTPSQPTRCTTTRIGATTRSTVVSNVAATVDATTRPSTRWNPPASTNLRANDAASLMLGSTDPAKDTLHFTFGSASMVRDHDERVSAHCMPHDSTACGARTVCS